MDWETQLSGFLSELLAVQDETLRVLTRKRELICSSDVDGLAELAPREEAVQQRLQQCLQRREELLGQARQEGRPAGSIGALARSLPSRERNQLSHQVQTASAHARLLQHQSLTNWVIVQRNLLHLSQMLEIIATGGRPRPTYGSGATELHCGSLVDHAV